MLISSALLIVGCDGAEGVGQNSSRSQLGDGNVQEVESENDFTMVRLPAGEFVMGDERGSEGEQPRQVRVDSFMIGKHPVTQELYESVMGDNPSNRKNPNNPVEQVRWSDAVRFCNALSEKEGLEPVYDLDDWSINYEANGYRLPTEAEWEYAARAGETGRYSFGEDESRLGDHAWFAGNSGGQPRPVGRKRPNAWGLHDMLGNVWEWTNDYYEAVPSGTDNPRGPESGDQRVVRGGAWDSRAERLAVFHRHAEEPGYADVCVGFDVYGFRIARNAD
ncbi:formylglycine-generating enzyme family protein [Phycisphaerales bacterium AB-hyl4]|uniref:Formylglycine-generating enzyme family protein n=1 Tax=Natronomicrosphaera hydrolytica TaxID=3242702 RepID=A0ABV4U8X9_9BACT